MKPPNPSCYNNPFFEGGSETGVIKWDPFWVNQANTKIYGFL